MKQHFAFAACVVAACSAVAVQAEAVVDPTRPPPSWMPADPKAVAKPKGEAQQAGGLPIQILLVGPTRRFALVRGEMIGEKGKTTRIVDVNRDNVIVQSERGRETLNLFPDVKKAPPKKPKGMGEKD